MKATAFRCRFPLPSKLRLIAWFTIISAAIGAIYAFTAHPESGRQPLLRAVSRGMLTGAVIACALTSLEIFLVDTPLAAPLRRLPFLATRQVNRLALSWPLGSSEERETESILGRLRRRPQKSSHR